MLKESRIIELEQTLLSMLIKQRDLFNELLKRTITDDFFMDDQNHFVFTALDQLHSKRLPFDFHLILDRVLKVSTSDENDPEEHLALLWEIETEPDTFEYILRFLDEQYLRRKAVTKLTDMVRETIDDHSNVFEVLNNGAASLYELIHPRRTRETKPIRSITKDVYNRIVNIQSNKYVADGISTGYPDLDSLLSGFLPGQVYVIASRPFVGKTTFLINLILNVLTNKKKNFSVLFYSPEISAEQISQRMLSSTSEVMLEKITRGKMEAEEIKKLYHNGVRQLSELDLTIIDKSQITIEEIRLKLQLSQMDPYEILFIDNLQLIERLYDVVKNKEGNCFMMQLKALAREFNIPVVVTSNLKRTVEQRKKEDRMPQLSDLPDYSDIEQNSDAILFLYRPEYYDMNTGKLGDTIVRVAKNRTGLLGNVQLRALLHIQKFIDSYYLTNSSENTQIKLGNNEINDNENGEIEFDEDTPF